MRDKGFLHEETSIGDHYDASVLSTETAIFWRDYHDCTKSDLILINLLGATDKSQGTIWEMAWAFEKRVRSVVAIEPTGNPHEHAFLRIGTNIRVPSLAEAIAVTRSMLLPG
jgi:hypothetical protein